LDAGTNAANFFFPDDIAKYEPCKTVACLRCISVFFAWFRHCCIRVSIKEAGMLKWTLA